MTPTAPQGTFKQCPFWRLRTRFRECGMYDSEVSQATGITQPTLSRRMRGVQPWTSDEITTVCRLLGIPRQQIGNYFFPDVEQEDAE